jgi:uroporphyrinogen decarboxylase
MKLSNKFIEMAPVNNLILRAARGEATEQIPVWMMRQAGRYLPEFHTVRSQHDFVTVCKTPAFAAELTVQPFRRFAPKLDACIVFSDILTIPAAMGQNLEMIKGDGPKLSPRLISPDDLKHLNLSPNVQSSLGYVGEAIRESIKQVKNEVPVIGFSGAPWTLFTYMVEGGGSRSWTESRAWLYKYPNESRVLLTAITNIIVDYLVMQIDAGAELLQVFDTNAGELPPSVYQEFIVPDLKRIATEVKRKRPNKASLICFPKDCVDLKPFNNSDYDVISVSWKTSPRTARLQCPDKVLQGNMDPAVLYAGDAVIRETVKRMVTEFGKERYIANLGHGMMPDMNPEMAASFINAVKSI